MKHDTRRRRRRGAGLTVDDRLVLRRRSLRDDSKMRWCRDSRVLLAAGEGDTVSKKSYAQKRESQSQHHSPSTPAHQPTVCAPNSPTTPRHQTPSLLKRAQTHFVAIIPSLIQPPAPLAPHMRQRTHASITTAPHPLDRTTELDMTYPRSRPITRRYQ